MEKRKEKRKKNPKKSHLIEPNPPPHHAQFLLHILHMYKNISQVRFWNPLKWVFNPSSPSDFFSPWPSNFLGQKSTSDFNFLFLLFFSLLLQLSLKIKQLLLCLAGKGSPLNCLRRKIFFALSFSRLSWKMRDYSSSLSPHLSLSAHLCTLHCRKECHLCKIYQITH